MYTKEENLEEFVVSLNPGGDGNGGNGGLGHGGQEGDQEGDQGGGDNNK